MQQIAKNFQGQPLVVLSVSLDSDEQKWKDFITKNGMTWVQYRDGGFTGPVANLFGVKAIPQTFTIDVDGVLQLIHFRIVRLPCRQAARANAAKALEQFLASSIGFPGRGAAEAATGLIHLRKQRCHLYL
jgi:hypothetical protein